MNRFRVLSGANLVRSSKPILTPALELEGLRVETETDVLHTTSPGGAHVFVVGTLVGRRDAAGRIHTLENPRAFVGSIVDDHAPSTWRQQYDGDAVMITVTQDGTVTVTGDPFFKRDVYVQKSDQGVTLAGDLAMVPDDPARDGYDPAALAHMLTYYGHRPPKQHTIYRSVRRLGIGDVATLKSGTLNVQQTPFVPVPTEEYSDHSLNRYTDAFLDYLASAGSSEGNSVFLSSGWDSSSILAGLVHVFGRKRVTAVTGRMLYSERSGNCNRFEMERAQKIAEHFDVPLHIVDLDYVNGGPDWIERVRDTFRDHNIQSQTGLNHARLAHGAAHVNPGLPLFAGEISDGAHNLGFSQYVTIFHPTQAFREYGDKMASYLFGPTFLREFLENRHNEDAVYRIFRDRNANLVFDEPVADAGDRKRQMLVSFFLRNGRMPLWSGRNVRMLTPDGLAGYTEEMSKAYLSGFEKYDATTVYSWYLHLYNSFHWQGSTVSTVQKMGDHFGLPAHNPYWASGIQQFLQAMPESWGRGLDLMPTKYPLKRMLREKLGFPMHVQVGPHSYTYDVDPTFNHSFELMHHSRLGPYAKQILSKKPYHQLLQSEWFNLSYIDEIVDTFVAGKEQRGTALNDLVSVWLLCQTGWYA
jgi:hypothetical protein